MVIYDYECTQCEAVTEMMGRFEDRELQCPKCQGNAKRIVSRLRSSQIDIFQEQTFEGMADGTPPISSKAQLARECEKQGIYSRMLMEGTRNHGRRREI